MSQSSVRTVRAERMPYPMEALWAAASRSGQVSEAHRAFENVVRLMTAVVLSDVLDLPWPSELEALLLGGPDRKGLSRMSLGTRLHLLERLVRTHLDGRAAAPSPRVLPDLGPWWGEVEPLLRDAIASRNLDAHDAGLRDDAVQAGFDKLATFLRASRWLADIQVISVETREHRLGLSRGTVQRLIGPSPFDTVQHRFDASWSGRLSDGLVHIGPRDGRRWVLCPFLAVGKRSLRLLDGFPKGGELALVDPFAPKDRREPSTPPALMPTADGDLTWGDFLARRLALAPSYRFEEPRPHALLQLAPGADATLVEGACVDPDHRLVRRLGGGAVADVWEVEDIHSQQRYALKIPRPESLNPEVEARFQREIELLKRLSTAGVRRVISPVDRLRLALDGGPVDALRMPLCRGTLADRLLAAREAQAAIPTATLLRWGCEALEALVDLHARGIVHRDLKPSNLLLDAQDAVVLADFGLARDLGEESRLTLGPLVPSSGHAAARSASPSDGVEVRHVAPELRRGLGIISGKADVHALAGTLHLLALGAPSVAPGDGIAEPLGPWLARMTRVDPEERPSAAEVLAAWRVLARGGGRADGAVGPGGTRSLGDGSRPGMPAVGQCPLCEGEGPVGAPCSGRVCAAQGVGCIPADYARLALAASANDREPLVGAFIDDFLIVGRLGRGTFGRVLLGLQRPLFKLRGAVKLLDFQASDDWAQGKLRHYFEREVEALSSLSSANVVRILRAGDFQAWPYLAMEYLPGGRTVETEIERVALAGESLPLAAIDSIVSHTLNGLEAAHAAGLVHRDIKPENLMLVTEGEDRWFVKLVDFGLARLAESSGRSTAVAGTLHYMAPEQFEATDFGPWTDLYALGVMLFELLLGQRPYTSDRTDVVMAQKRDPAFDPLRVMATAAVPELLGIFLRKALHSDPARRYRSVREFREAWRRVATRLDLDGGVTTDLTELLDLSNPAVRARVKARLERLEALEDPTTVWAGGAAVVRLGGSLHAATEGNAPSADAEGGQPAGSRADAPAAHRGPVANLELGGPTTLMPRHDGAHRLAKPTVPRGPGPEATQDAPPRGAGRTGTLRSDGAEGAGAARASGSRGLWWAAFALGTLAVTAWMTLY